MEKIVRKKEVAAKQEVISHRRERAEHDVRAELTARGAKEAHEQIAVLKELLSRYGATTPGTNQAADESLYYHAEEAARLLYELEPNPAEVYLATIMPEEVAENDPAYRLTA